MEETQWRETEPAAPVGLYGWQKRCLYVVLLLLVFVVTLNVTLVLWITKVLQINANGIKQLQVVGSGIQFPGRTYVLDTLVASQLFTRPGQTVSLESAHNLTLGVLDHATHLASSLQLVDDRLDINTPLFKVSDPRGKTLFSVDKDTVSLTAGHMSIMGEGGSVFEGMLQTPIVSADIRSDLVLESVTRAVQAVTAAGVSIESRAGNILASSLEDISLITVDGSIKIESANVLLPGLRGSHHSRKHPQHPHHSQHSQQPQNSHQLQRPDGIYQLCVCGSGELYLGGSDTVCEPGVHNEMCR